MQSTPIWIYNKNEEFLRIIDIQDYDIPHYDSWFTEQLNGAITLEFSIPANHPDASLIENDGRAVIRDKDGELVEFIIRQPQDSNGPNGPEKRVFAEGGDYELIDEWMTGYRANNVTLQTALEAVTSHTRWKIGHVDDFGTNSVDIKPTTVKNAIVQLLQIFGGQVKYRVEADGNRITRRYIDVYRKRGDFKGKRFETGKDVRTITYTPDSTGIKTALYGYGASGENDGPRLTFADVEWSKANGDPVDKPLGQIWVGDPEALQRWGYDGGTRHRFGEYSGQEEDPAELLLNTWNHLQELTNEVRTYELEVALLQDIPGYEHEEVRLGDTVLVIDRELQPNIEAQANIIEYRQNLNDDSLDEVVVGQFRNTIDIAGRQRSIEQVIEEKQGNWDKKETPEGALEKANQKAQEAIEEAQKRINQAKVELEEAMIDLDEAMQIADNVFDDKILNPQNYKGYFEGDVGITGELHVSGTIIGGSDAIISGTLNAQNLNLYQANILNANIQDATITGTLSGVDGTFIGDLVGATGTFSGDLTAAKILIGGDISTLDRWEDFPGSELRILMPYWNSEDGWYWDGFFSLQLSSGNVRFTGTADIVFDFYRPAHFWDGISVLGTIDGTITHAEEADNALQLGGLSASSYARSNHNHDGRYTRNVGSDEVGFQISSSGNLAVYRNNVYIGFIPIN